MNLHHVDHTGASRKYYLDVLKYINNHPEYGVKITQSSLSDFITEGAPLDTDVLSYQTFPDETNIGKFNPDVIGKADARFLVFGGKKILVDLHDCGDKDSFTRIPNGEKLPRVKAFPSKWFLRNYNVILLSSVNASPGTYRKEHTRDIFLSCKFGKKEPGFYGHKIREEVMRYLLESFHQFTSFEWVPSKIDYFEELRRTVIVIGAPGWGRHSQSYWGAFKAGALLFAHRSLNEIKLFPHSDIIDGEDYVSYDLYDFKVKLRRIMFDKDEIERIRNNGRRKFKQGLNHKKSAEQLVKFLKQGG